MDYKSGSFFRDICACAVPTPILKFGRGGKLSKPGFRLFCINGDLTALTWVSKMRGKKDGKKKGDEKELLINDVTEIVNGQRTDKFKRNNRPDLKNLSFSLKFTAKGKSDTLDLVCKDEKEFQTWTTVLRILHERQIPESEMNQLRTKIKQFISEQANNPSGSAAAKNDEEKENDVYGFGWGGWGQNGLGGERKTTTPKLLSGLLGKGAVGVACGWSHTCVLLEDGELLQYGNKVGTHLEHDAFVPMSGVSERMSISAVACGAYHTAAVTTDGHCLTWGSNLFGQLGHGHTHDVKTPTVVEDLLSTGMGLELYIDQVACCTYSTAALGEDGNVYTWGCGEHGVLGHGDAADLSKPAVVKALTGNDIKLMAAGDSHIVACTDHETYTWGWNACGQLGLGHEEDQARPHPVEALHGKAVSAISAGAVHCLAIVDTLTKKGTVYAWGSNAHGQTGQGALKKVDVPTVLHLPEEMTVACCGSLHTCLLSEKGNLWSVGYNEHGQLGHGHTLQLDEFKQVAYFNSKLVKVVACGGEHTAVLSERMWLEDKEAKECMKCKTVFTFTNRKHHCRNCMGIFCGACSSKKFAILKTGSTKPLRVCGPCYTQLGGC